MTTSRYPDNRDLDALPFGKYRGVPIDQVPTDYLLWAIENFDAQRSPDVVELVEAEYARRERQGLA